MILVQQSRQAQIAELTAVFLFGQFCFWGIETLPPAIPLLLPLMILASMVWHRNSLSELGLQTDGFTQCLFHYKKWFLFISLLLVLDIVTGKIQTVAYLVLANHYLLSVIVQQLIFFAYFANRLSKLHDTSKTQAWVAVIFALFHLPNIPLTVITLIGGYVCAGLFLKYRNLWALIVLHYVTSIVINYDVFPVLKGYIPIDHFWNMRVGLGYFK